MSTMEWSNIFFVIVAAALGIYLLFAERSVRSRVPLWARYVATVLALAALVALLFPITVPGDTTHEPATGATMVLTAGTPDTILDAQEKATRMTTDTAIAQQYGLPLINDWRAFSDRLDATHLSIYGYGLTDNQLRHLPRGEINYHRPSLPEGFLTCDWPLQLHTSERLTVRGQYHHRGDDRLTLVLLNASVAVDSVVIDSAGVHPFTLHHRPPQLGNSLLELSAIRGTDTLGREPVPVRITTPPSLRILMLAASPSFEHRFLSNWFEAMHYEVAARTRISSDRFSAKTNAAMELTTLPDHLNGSTFSQVDLLVADEAEVAALSANERAAILDATANGMGFLLLKGADGEPSLPGLGFRTLGARNTDGQAVTVAGAGITFPELLPPAIVPLRDNPSHRSLLHIGEHTVAATRLYGRGRITATTLSGTYSWWLKDNQAAYGQFWSSLLDRTLAVNQPKLRYVQAPRFPVPYSWMTLGLTMPNGPLWVDGRPYPILQHAYLEPLHETSLWLAEPGWHTLHTAGLADTAAFYVYRPADWQAARSYASMVANETALADHRLLRAAAAPVAPDTSGRELPKWPFVVVFLAAATVLWYASRDI